MALRNLSDALLVAFVAISAASQSSGDDDGGDFTEGKSVYFSRCIACHEPPSEFGLTDADRAMNEAALPADDEEATPTRGPTLSALIGRTAGRVPGFTYSPAMAVSDVVWGEESLRAFLLKPSAAMPGNRMTFNGLKRPGEQDDLIAYLMKAAN